MTTEAPKEEPKTPVTDVKPSEKEDITITAEEFEKLVGVVKTKAAPDTKEIYERAAADVRAELEKAQSQKLESLTRKAETERIAKLEAELAALKAAPAQATHTRKGFSNTENPFKKTEDGKLGIRTDEFEAATKRFLNPNAR